MRNKIGAIFIAVGLMLILFAGFLFVYFEKEDKQAGNDAEEVMLQLKEIVEEKSKEEIDGYEYIGYLYIPVLKLELPVMAEWDYQRLKIAPCRQFGSTKSNDLVIAGHNYSRHFGQLSSLKKEDLITFTDMDGEISIYQIGDIDILFPEDVETVKNSGRDLVLYTCTYSGEKRVVIFCDKLEEAKKWG